MDYERKNKKRQVKIAMIGHKMVPSRCGGIEFVLTTICPMLVEKGHDVTCYNRAGGKLENEYVGTVKNNMYKGVKLKKVFTLNKKGLAAMTSSFLLQFVLLLKTMTLSIFMLRDHVLHYGFQNCLERNVFALFMGLIGRGRSGKVVLDQNT